MSKLKDRPQEDRWTLWTRRLSPAAQHALQRTSRPEPPDEDAQHFDAWRQTLGVSAQEVVDRLSERAVLPAPAASPEDMSWGLVEASDGEPPVLRVFPAADGLVRRLADLNNTDVYVWVFWGVPLPLSRGPQRHMLLPDRETALTVPLYPGCVINRVSLSEIEELAMQDDGFLGPPELSVTRLPYLEGIQRQPRGRPRDDDDEEEEEAVAD